MLYKLGEQIWSISFILPNSLLKFPHTLIAENSESPLKASSILLNNPRKLGACVAQTWGAVCRRDDQFGFHSVGGVRHGTPPPEGVTDESCTGSETVLVFSHLASCTAHHHRGLECTLSPHRGPPLGDGQLFSNFSSKNWWIVLTFLD